MYDLIAKAIARENAIIAGGAVRDYILDKPIKDIDVFIKTAGPKTLAAQKHRFHCWGLKLQEISCNKNLDKGYSDNHIEAVYTVAGSDPEIQLIFVSKDPVDFVHENFDIGLCKCFWVLGENKIHQTAEFHKDMISKTLTVRAGRQNSAHLERVKEKYPDYTVMLTL